MTGVSDGQLLSPWMNPEFIDAIARRVVELGAEAQRDQSSSNPNLLTVTEVAERLSVSPAWVYAHKHELGAIRLGDGPKARLRFHVGAVVAGLTGRSRAAEPNGNGNGVRPKRARRRLASRPLPR